jgi:hypothetical protein
LSLPALHGIDLDDVAMLIICLLICWKYLQIKLAKPDPYHNVWFERPQGNQKLNTVTQERNIAKIVESQVYLATLFHVVVANFDRAEKGHHYLLGFSV